MRGHVAFPNGSRNYDATRLAVRFWGYDQSMEVPFFISAAVLGALQPASAEKPEDCLSAFDAHRARICTVAAMLGALQPASAEKPEDCLSAFDAHRARICTVAAKVYERRRSGSYDLLASDF